MNKRIQELAKQCYSDHMNFDHEKFAELIVNECADWIDSNVGMIDEEARHDLLKHFGVKE